MNQMSNNNLMQGDIIYQIRSSEAREVIGDSYFDSHWSKSSILLNDGRLIEGKLIRYDIRLNEFEIRLSDVVKVIDGNLVKNVVWIDSIDMSTRYFVSTREFNWDGPNLNGFVELLAEGSIPLMKRIVIEILKPDYNIALNVGSKDFRVIKKVKYYYGMDSNLFEVKKKATIKNLKNKVSSIEEFINKEPMSWGNQKDLVALFTYINSELKEQ